MAKVWLSVIVLILVQDVFAEYCKIDREISTCDVCIRCGGSWCGRETDDKRCASSVTDVFCDGMPENPKHIHAKSTDGQALFPSYVERTVYVGIPNIFELAYSSPFERKVIAEIDNTTQSFEDIIITPEVAECKGNRCKLNIEAKVGTGFCTSSGSTDEYVFVKIKVDNITEEVVVKYHVPCACECSKQLEKNSPRCSGHGDFACGACKCEADWTGKKCEVLSCKANRGDVDLCSNPLKEGVNCSGNGKCGPCETCICYEDREGSQYFDPRYFCSDICMDINNSGCDRCLTNGTLGRCGPGCGHPMTLLAYNETIAAEMYDNNRKVWVRCNGSFQVTKEDNTIIEYFAMKEESGHINIMVINSTINNAPLGSVETKVPIILGVLGIIAAVAALGGVVLWKHLNATPPMPFSSPDYQNIDAEDCVGENPLYKSPTTTFTNPQFGKC